MEVHLNTTKPTTPSQTSIFQSDQPQLHPLQQNQQDEPSLTASLATGMIAKICVNNLNRTVARFQLGYFKPDLTFHSAKSQLFGASIQSLGVFKTRELLKADHTDDTAASHVVNFGKNFTAGVVGGLAMHPACVPFFYMQATPAQNTLFPSIRTFASMAIQKKEVFTRGIGFRGMSTGLEFGVYFTLKNLNQNNIENSLTREITSSLPAILLAVPFHQKYIQAMNTEPNTVQTQGKAWFKMPSPRHFSAFLLFTAINMLELGVLDQARKQLTALIDTQKSPPQSPPQVQPDPTQET